MLSAPSIRGSKQIMHFSNRSNYRILAPGLILWRLYSAPNGRIFDGSDRPSMWSDIQSSSDGRPSTLCPEWSWEIFNAFCPKVFFTPEMLASSRAHHLINYGVAPSEAPDVYNYTVVWDVENLVSRVGCFLFLSQLSRVPMLAFSRLSLHRQRVLFARLFVRHLVCRCARRRKLLP